MEEVQETQDAKRALISAAILYSAVQHDGWPHTTHRNPRGQADTVLGGVESMLERIELMFSSFTSPVLEVVAYLFAFSYFCTMLWINSTVSWKHLFGQSLEKLPFIAFALGLGVGSAHFCYEIAFERGFRDVNALFLFLFLFCVFVVFLLINFAVVELQQFVGEAKKRMAPVGMTMLVIALFTSVCVISVGVFPVSK